MVDAREAAHEAANKLMSKGSRWRTKIFSNNSSSNAPSESPPKQEIKPAASFKLDDDVNAFLKPSTDRAQSQRDAAAAYLASTNRPRIDVARAQRWPAAQEIISSAAGGRSPGPGGLKTSTRRKGLTVGFVRTVPEIIGHGGDECEEPAAEVSRRKTQHSRQPPPMRPQDDANLNATVGRTLSQTEQRNSLTRTLTSHGEKSPPLDKRLEMGQINTYAAAPPPLPQRMGPMGLGERPPPLSRAPTGFDNIPEPAARRPSESSSYSQDSDNFSTDLSRKISNREPTIQEEEDFRPKTLSRAQTGFNEQPKSSQESMQPVPRLSEMHQIPHEEESPLDNKAILAERFLQSDPNEPNSFSARVKQRMRSEEGRALHEAAQKHAAGQDSDTSSLQSVEPPQSAASPPHFQPQPTNMRTPPQPSYEMSPPRASLMRNLDAADPQRSRARGLSPARNNMPGTFQPQGSSIEPQRPAQYPPPPAPIAEPLSALSANSVQQTPQGMVKPPFPVAIQHANSPNVQPQEQQRIPAYAPPQAVPASIPQPQILPIRQPQEVRAQPPSQSSQNLGRSDTRMLGEVAFKDFAGRVIHMKGIFQLTAQLGGSIYDRSPTQWLRVATWWFLRGRTGMEAQIRGRAQSSEAQVERLTQPHVDLAKVLWILTDVIPNHPGLPQYGGQSADAQADLARQAGDMASTEAYEVQGAILHYMKMLVGSMKKHSSMPPTQALIQGQDQSIWVEYPQFAPDAGSVLQAGFPRPDATAGPVSYSLSQFIPLADTKIDFCYFRMFVKASLSTDDPNTDRVPMTAVISVLRPKEIFQVKLAICSQNDTINILLGSGGDAGPSWNDVNWKKQNNSISIILKHGFTLTLELAESDFRSLWAIVDHTSRVQMDLRERRDERFSCKLNLREASYKDPSNPSAFPQGRVQACKLMVFEKIDRSSEGTGKRKLHRGYRMVLATNQQSKQVSLVNLELGTKHAPVNFEYITEPDQTPGMRLAFREEGTDGQPRLSAAHLIFQEAKDRNHLFGTFTSMNISEGETVFAQVPLKSFQIESADQAEGFSQKGSRVLERLQWQEAKVMNQDPEHAGLEAAPTVMSESLRIVCRHSAGIIADRMNLGPGELLVRLPIDGAPELTLLREAQQDLTMAVDGSRTEPDIPDSLAELLQTLTSASTVRKLTFNSFKDLHAFQFAVTGFEVKFDGIASSFSISRRRMVVPIYKQWTANIIRIQVVQQDNIVQLLAFFEEFSHADAMNFKLSTMDTFEKSDKSGKFGLKLVDAKFALPVEERRGEGKMQKEEGKLTGWAGSKRKFVCLDEIEYPGEHDDILIQFDSAETRDMFAAALPAATMERKFTVRRKI